MRQLPQFAGDELVTRYEIEYTERQIVKVLGEQLIGRRLFANGINNGGWNGGPGKKYYTYYREVDQDSALISMEGTTQANSKSMRDDYIVRVPAITQTFMIQWRDMETAKSEGFDLLSFHAMAAARKIAESEDELMVTGEHTNFEAYGVEGLATATGRNTNAGGNWGTAGTATTNILAGWALLQEDGFYDPPVLIAGPTLMKCIMAEKNAASDMTELNYLLQNGIISGWMETSNLFTGATQDTTALLVAPDPNYLYYVEGQAPKLTVTLDKDGNYYGLIRETIAPVIARPECVNEITGLSCT